MKTNIFIALLLIIGLTVTAQRKDSGSAIPGLFIHNDPGFPAKPVTSNNIFHQKTGLTDFKKDVEFTSTIGDSHSSSSFNPTWAARFQFVLDSIMSFTTAKGISLAVMVPGEGLLTVVRGISHPGTLITAETRFGIMSNTKLFIAATLAELQDQGVLSLDDHLYQWLPPHPNIDSNTTIRQMLMHESGIFDYWNDTTSNAFNMWADTSRFWTTQEILSYVGPQHFAPGTGFRYSNTNYLLAGMVIEAATGSTWVQKLSTILFDPLDLDSTFVGVFENRNGPVAAEYFGIYPIFKSPMTAEYSQVNAAGAIQSTSQEMAGWYNSLFTGAAISDPALAQVTNFEPTTWNGLGITLNTYDNLFAYGHGGGSYGYNSYFWFDEQSKATLCLMTNDGLGSFNDRLFPLLKVFYRDRPKKQHDAGISGIDAPWGNSCSGTRVPKVSITNYGSTTLTSAIIRYRIDGGAPVDFNWTGSLATGDTIRVVLPQINVSAGSHTFTCYTTLPNGTPEGNNYNDTSSSIFVVTATPAMLAEIDEGFEGAVFPPSGWSESNSTHFSWDRTTLAYHSGGVSVVKNNWNDYRIGSTYDLDLPLIHVAGGTHPRLEFNYAYALYPNYFGDTLQVLVSNDCGATWHKLFNKGGADLPTADTTRLRFYPRGGDDWQHEAYSLAAYPGDLQIRFRNVCGFGQNLYLDNVMVSFPTNVTGNQAQFDFNLYPNPSSTAVNISGLPLNSEIIITDLAGKLLLKENTKNSIATVNIGHLPKGIYILKSNSGAKKIVKL